MPVGYRSSSTSGTGDTQGTSKAIPVPSGAAAGDIALLAVELWWDNATNPTVTWPSGFTEIINVNLDADQGWVRLKVAWKRITGADSGSYTPSWTGTQWNMGHCILITGGLASGDPIEATHTATTLTGTSVPTTTVSPAAAGDMLVHFATNETSATQSTVPTGFTNVQNHIYLRTNYRISAASGSQSASGGVITTGGPQVAALIAVKPEAGGATDLVVAGATQAHTSGSPALTQVHSLAANAATQAQTSGSPALTQVHVLTVAGANQAHTADSPALVQNSDLVVAGATQPQTSGNVTLTQVHVLSVSGALQQLSSDEVSLSGEVTLTVAAAVHALTSGSPSLTQVHGLAVGSATQNQAAGQVDLQQVHVLTVAGGVQAQAVDVVGLTAGGSLDVQPTTQAQTSSNLTLTQQHTLAVDASVLTQSAAEVTLTQIHALLVASALQAQFAEVLELVAIGEYEAPQEGFAVVRPFFTIAVVRPVTATAVVRSPSATATVRSTDEAG